MRDIIGTISNTFIEEAKASPRMLEDLAAMEKYMSESYDGRTFVELIQNADDAESSRIRVDYVGSTLIVANDGRSFDENDIMAICRSGSSNKQRGNSIGYRGVGFKSATTISTEIIIYSSGAYFTFSKSQCAEILGMTESKVPTVRIPFLFDEEKLGHRIVYKIEELESDGFTTFFIFKDAKIEKFKDELIAFNSSWLLFLRKISNVEINLPSWSVSCKVTRKQVGDDKLVKIVGSKEQWFIVERGGVSLAFRYDDEKGIVSCNAEDAVFHCYLPTIDKTGFPFKVNADFSTDPSRKHIISDDITKRVLEKAGELFADFLIRATSLKDEKKILALGMLESHFSLGELVSKLEQQIDNQLRIKPWVLKNNGERTTVQNVNYLPGWMEQEEKKLLANVQPQIGYNLYSNWFYEGIEKIEKLLSKYGATEVSQEVLRDLIIDPDKASALGERIVAKILIYSYRGSLSDSDKLGSVFIPTSAGYLKLSETNDSNEIGQDFISILSTMLSPKEKTALSEMFAVFACLKKRGKAIRKPTASLEKLPSKKMAMAVNKWKSPIQNCLAVEIFEGRSGKDVSRKCEDYSVESVDAIGNTHYIAVKKVKSIGDSFALSEKEYAAAQRLGEAYKVFIISLDGEKVDYLYITNPCDTVILDKTVKEWEFICNSYDIPEKKNVDTDESLVDERMLKYLAEDYFVSNQKAFLKELIASGEMVYDASLSNMVEKINGVVDFYTGETLLDVRDGQIIVERSKMNAIRKILGPCMSKGE